MNNRQRFYSSNRKARSYILDEMNGSDVYFKEHLRRKSKFYFKTVLGEVGFYQATDFFNLFDGLCFIGYTLCFFQIKTNAFPATKAIDDFLDKHDGFGVFAINVRTKTRDVKLRWYNQYGIGCSRQ